ncbi:MAG: hypothetical protein WCN99_06015 [bacterium]
MKKLLVVFLVVACILPGIALAEGPQKPSYQVPLWKVADGVHFQGSYAMDYSTALVKAYRFDQDPRFSMEAMVQFGKVSYLTFLYYGPQGDTLTGMFLFEHPSHWVVPPDSQGAGLKKDTLMEDGHRLLGETLLAVWPEAPIEGNPFDPVLRLFTPLHPGHIYQPLSPIDQQTMQKQLEALLAVPLSASEGPLEFSSEIAGTFSQLEAKGTGVQVPLFATYQKLTGWFQQNGWTADSQFFASGVTGEVMGYRQEQKLAVIQVLWLPLPGYPFGPDKPIDINDFPPDQQVMRVLIQIGEIKE